MTDSHRMAILPCLDGPQAVPRLRPCPGDPGVMLAPTLGRGASLPLTCIQYARPRSLVKRQQVTRRGGFFRKSSGSRAEAPGSGRYTRRHGDPRAPGFAHPRGGRRRDDARLRGAWAALRGVRGCARRGRPGGAAAGRAAADGPDRPGFEPAVARRRRGLPAHPPARRHADHHADGPRRRRRARRRARSGRGRLPAQAVQVQGAAGPDPGGDAAARRRRPGGAAARAALPEPRHARGRA